LERLSQTIESTKAASEIYLPLSGEIIEVNEALNKNPELINQSPYEEGWIVKIRIEDKKEVENLLDETSYEKFLKESS